MVVENVQHTYAHKTVEGIHSPLDTAHTDRVCYRGDSAATPYAACPLQGRPYKPFSV